MKYVKALTREEIETLQQCTSNHKKRLVRLRAHAVLLSDKGYKYGIHWLPHDAFTKRLGMGGQSIMQQLFKLDIGEIGKVPNLKKRDGIEAARATFPHCYFDHKCSEGLESLKSYHRKYDEVKKVFSDEPVHDEHSHPADAWIYLSLTWRQSVAQSPEMSQIEHFNRGNIVNVNFGQIKKAHFKKKREYDYY